MESKGEHSGVGKAYGGLTDDTLLALMVFLSK